MLSMLMKTVISYVGAGSRVFYWVDVILGQLFKLKLIVSPNSVELQIASQGSLTVTDQVVRCTSIRVFDWGDYTDLGISDQRERRKALTPIYNRVHCFNGR